MARLLIEHITNRKDQINQEKIVNAVNALKRVDYKALCALTLMSYVTRTQILYRNIEDGIIHADYVLNKLEYSVLPKNNDWVFHLDDLGLCRVAYGFTPIEYNKFLLSFFDVNTGIKIDSNEHKQAIDIINKNKLGECLIKNPFNTEYLILNKLYLRNKQVPESLTRLLSALYDNKIKNEIEQMALNKIEQLTSAHKSFMALKELMNQLQLSFNILPTGIYLSNMNITRLGLA